MTARTARRVLATLAGLAVFALVLVDAELTTTLALCRKAGPLLWLAPLPQGAGLLLQAGALARLVARLGTPTGLRHALSTTVATELSRLTLPAGGAAADAVGVWWLRARLGLDLERAVAAIAVRKWLLLVTNGVHLVGVLVAVAVSPPAEVGPPGLATLGGLMGVALTGLGLAAWAMAAGLSTHALATRAWRLCSRVRSERLRRWLEGRRESFEATDRGLARPWRDGATWRPSVPGLLHQLLWLLETVETWFFAKLVGVELGLVEALLVEACAGLVRAAAFAVPGGLGAQDASYVALFRALGAPDAASHGAAFVLLRRGKELVWIAVATIATAATSARHSSPDDEVTR